MDWYCSYAAIQKSSEFYLYIFPNLQSSFQPSLYENIQVQSPRNPLQPPRQLNRKQNRYPRGHLHRLSPDMVARANLPPDLSLPVLYIPLEACRTYLSRPREGDDADVFFEEVVCFILCFFL